MKYTAKHWAITIRIADVLIVGLVLFIAWLTWSLYHETGVIRMPLGFSSVLWFAVFVVLRVIAKNEKKKAEDAEAKESAAKEISK
jgi:TRAP-type C4-dicarboxylate transport system permease small subunit